MGIIKEIGRVVFGIRRHNNRELQKFAKGIAHKKILELGSGESDFFSAKQHFHYTNEFIQSDINPEYGRKIVDVMEMKYKEQFDIVLCINILEHVVDYQKAIDNCYKAVKKGGIVIFFTPVCYPLHQEPTDYWRFTEHAYRIMLKKFEILKLQHSGLRIFPFSYIVICQK